MPSIVKTALKDDAIYWQVTEDGFVDRGEALPPVQIKCRWIEGFEERQKVATATALVDRDTTVGSFIMLGTLDDLIPSNTDENYPPENAQLDARSAHWAFEDDLLGSVGGEPAFDLVSGTPAYIVGAFNKGLSSNGGDFSLLTPTDLNVGAIGTLTLSAFVKLDRAAVGDTPIATITVGALQVVLGYDLITLDDTEFAVAAGWSSTGYRGIAAQFVVGEVPKLFIAGSEVLPSVVGTPVAAIVDAPVAVFTDLDSGNGHGELLIDELLAYATGVLTGKSLQLLASAYPTYYPNAELIEKFQAANSLNGRQRVRRVWLKGKNDG